VTAVAERRPGVRDPTYQLLFLEQEMRQTEQLRVA